MKYKLVGDAYFDTAIRENQTPEETVAAFIKKLQESNQMIQATGKVSQTGNGVFEFVISVIAYVEFEGDDEEEIRENLEECLIDCDLESNMTIFDIDFDYSYDESDDIEDENE